MQPFLPLPWLCNPHVQTILSNLLPAGSRLPISRRRLVTLDDGDRLVLHETAPADEHQAAPIALLAHGLGGSHRSSYMIRMASRLRRLGWRVFRLDLRGAGAGAPFASRLYSANCSGDIRQAVDAIAAAYPDSSIALIGFSLGGALTLKYLGEAGDAPNPALQSAIALGPPIDLLGCSNLIAKLPFYDRWYVRHLMQQVAAHHRLRPDTPAVSFPPNASLRIFDDVYTAPRQGFRDALDYYEHASALPKLRSIRVPTFILTARDDPFVAVESFESIAPSPYLQVHIAEHGGHLGFLGADGAGGIRWAETRMIEWLTMSHSSRIY